MFEEEILTDVKGLAYGSIMHIWRKEKLNQSFLCRNEKMKVKTKLLKDEALILLTKKVWEIMKRKCTIITDNHNKGQAQWYKVPSEVLNQGKKIILLLLSYLFSIA